MGAALNDAISGAEGKNGVRGNPGIRGVRGSRGIVTLDALKGNQVKKGISREPTVTMDNWLNPNGVTTNYPLNGVLTATSFTSLDNSSLGYINGDQSVSTYSNVSELLKKSN